MLYEFWQYMALYGCYKVQYAIPWGTTHGQWPGPHPQALVRMGGGREKETGWEEEEERGRDQIGRRVA